MRNPQREWVQKTLRSPCMHSLSVIQGEDMVYAGTEQIEVDVAWRIAYDNFIGSCARVGVDDMAEKQYTTHIWYTT